MAETTGQLDKLIEEKVNTKISEFTKSIREQITKFLVDNGDYSGDHVYTVSKWTADRNGSKIPESFSHESLYHVEKGLIAGISKSVKDKMVARATKQLLEKVSLLS
jgi:hypothetical protein